MISKSEKLIQGLILDNGGGWVGEGKKNVTNQDITNSILD